MKKHFSAKNDPSKIQSHYYSRWVVLPFALLASISSGSNYAWSLYSNTFKTLYRWNQTQITTLGVANGLGGYVPLPALVMDRFGFLVTMQSGAFLIFAGYFVSWLVARQTIDGIYGVSFAANFTWAVGNSFVDSAVMTSAVQNFPQQRGLAIGLMKGFLGLGAGVLAELYCAIFRPDPTNFVLFLGVVLSSIAFVCSFFVRGLPPAMVAQLDRSEPHARQWLTRPYYLIVALALYLTVIGLASAGVGAANVSNGVHIALCVPMVGILATFVLLPRGTGPLRLNTRDLMTVGEEPEERSAVAYPIASSAPTATADHKLTPLLAAAHHDDDSGGPRAHPMTLVTRVTTVFDGKTGYSVAAAQAVRRRNANTRVAFVDAIGEENLGVLTVIEQDNAEPEEDELRTVDSDTVVTPATLGDPHKPELPAIGENMTVLQAAHHGEFWLSIMIMITCVGAGSLVNYNLGQYVPSLGGTADDTPMFTAFFSIASSAGRITAGFITDRYKTRVGRPVFVILVAISNFAVTLCMVFVDNIHTALPCVFLVGFGHGAFFVISPAITSELFGTLHFASLYAIIGMGPMVSAIFISDLLASHIYAINTHLPPAPPGTDQPNDCIGQACYHDTFLVVLCMIGLSVVCASVLWWRTRALYTRIKAQLLKSQLQLEALAAGSSSDTAREDDDDLQPVADFRRANGSRSGSSSNSAAKAKASRAPPLQSVPTFTRASAMDLKMVFDPPPEEQPRSDKPRTSSAASSSSID